jgi:hypothetical protein
MRPAMSAAFCAFEPPGSLTGLLGGRGVPSARFLCGLPFTGSAFTGSGVDFFGCGFWACTRMRRRRVTSEDAVSSSDASALSCDCIAITPKSATQTSSVFKKR